MKYKAIFFDRDGTLAYRNPEKAQWFKSTVEGWSGKEYASSYEKFISLMDAAADYKDPWFTTVDEETAVFKKYYELLLQGTGVEEGVPEKADMLFENMWCKSSILYDDTIDTLEYFKSKNYIMGVISDTGPSLGLSLENLKIAEYFLSFTSSSEAGVMKPDPAIYNLALSKHNLKPHECLYVDDYDIEAEGARKIGFASFHLDRQGDGKSKWTINSLRKLVKFAEGDG